MSASGRSDLDGDESLRSLLQSFPGAVWVVDAELRVQEAFGRDLEALGLGIDGVRGRALAEILGAGGAEALAAHQSALKGVSGGYQLSFGGRLLRARVEPLLDRAGVVRGVVGMSVDVSELQAAERQLAEFGAIVASSSDAIIGKSLDGTVTSWNAGAERIYGYTAAEIVGRSITTIVPPERLDELEPILKRAARGEATENLITTRVRKDGSRITVALTVSPVRGRDGSIVGSSAIARDITDALEVQAALHASEALRRSVVEWALDAVVMIDAEGTILEFNPAAVKTFGYGREDALGRQMVELIVPPRLRDAHRQGFARYLSTGESRILGKRLELSAVGSDGHEFPIELAIVRVPGTGDPVFTGFVRDISERKAAVEALQRSEESYRLLFERHPTPMWLFDPETLRYLAVNESAIAAYGYTREEFLAMTIEQIRPDEDVDALHEAVSDLGRERGVPAVWRHLKKDGTTIDVRVESNQIEFEGRPVRLVLAQDVTEQRRLEEQLRQTQKMEAIGNLAGGVAHDFNNILLVIRGVSGMLLAQLDGDARERVLEIDLAAQRAAEVTQQLLAFSRQQILRPEAVDLTAVLEETLGLLGRLIGEDIELVTKLEPGLSPVLIDRTQLQQVVLNLLVNARDAMRGGGRLGVRATHTELDERYAASHVEVSAGRYVLLEVTDTGVGMDPETRARVFDPFFTTKETGTGLGLATVYGILKQSGGHIAVYSEPGIGTTFRVYLRPAGEEVQERPAAPQVESLSGSETILLVEDAEAVRRLVVEILEPHGYTVIAASDGAEALELARQQPHSVDLLLTDVVMPRMSGRELAEQLSAEDPGLKVLFTSGYPADTVVRHGVAEARVAFIQKPYSAEELLYAIRQALETDSSDDSTEEH